MSDSSNPGSSLGNADLVYLIWIIEHPSCSINEFAKGNEISERQASRIVKSLKGISTITAEKDGNRVILVPILDSPISGAIKELMELEGGDARTNITKIIRPLLNLKLISALQTGPRTISQLITKLDISHATLHRIVSALNSNGLELIKPVSGKEKSFTLNDKNPALGHISGLGHSLWGDTFLIPPKPHTIDYEPESLSARLFFHLSNNAKYRNAAVMPIALTQKGIASALWTKQAIVSNGLQRHIERGLVKVKTANVRYEKRKYKTYHLSNKGIEEAERLQSFIETFRFPFIDINGTKRRIGIDKIPAMSNLKITQLEVLNYLKDERVINFVHLQTVVEQYRESEFISNLTRPPDLRYFYGREEELDTINEYLAKQGPSLVFIRGLAGIGKTTLLRKLIRDYQKKFNIFYTSFNEWSTTRNILKFISKFLQKLKRPQLSYYLKNRDNVVVEEILHIIWSACGETRSLLIFDDVHKVQKNVLDFLVSLLNYDIPQTAKVLVAGRELTVFRKYPGLDDKSYVNWMDLMGLDQASSKNLLKRRGIKAVDWNKIFEITAGHPLALELIDPRRGRTGFDIHQFLKQEVTEKLTEDEKRLMQFLSVFRYSVPYEAFGSKYGLSGINYENIDEMIERSHLIKISSTIKLHDVFKDFFYGRMKKDKKRVCHYLASEYYNSLNNSYMRIERMFHLIMAGEYQQVGELFIEEGEVLIRRGFSEDLKEILENVDEINFSNPYRIHFNFIIGEALFFSGDWERSLNCFKSALSISKEEFEYELITKIKYRMGSIYFNRGDMKDAIREYREVMGLAGKYRQYIIQSNSSRELCSLYYVTGKREECLDYYYRTKEIGYKTGSRECLANYYGLGWVPSRLMKDNTKSEEDLKKAIEMFSDLDHKIQYLRAMNNLGLILQDQEKWSEALDIYEKQIYESNQIGAMRLQAFGLYNGGISLVNLKMYDEAESRLLRAHSQFKLLNDKRMLSNTEGDLGTYFGKIKDYESACKYFESAIAGYKELKIVENLPEFLFEYGEVKSILGEKKQARKLYRESLKYAKKAQQEKWMKKAQERLGS